MTSRSGQSMMIHAAKAGSRIPRAYLAHTSRFLASARRELVAVAAEGLVQVINDDEKNVGLDGIGGVG